MLTLTRPEVIPQSDSAPLGVPSVVRCEEIKPGLWRIVERAITGDRTGLSQNTWREIIGDMTRSEAAEKLPAVKRAALTL